ncbi:putative GntR family transcriptional regulator [Streptomyces sp. NBRC 110611]|uniref:aminotransferase-like domain-containing protein n=1 Tax=Streptomyces sp. NBRC 110611 TaxID=1621259 RepID=UPI000857086C|nr:PLP-dependent aminotransferase family protein [Streptomyces sp. NBRC 110611]GAU66158.1 putative GntR family transcriptional regulator [Streptomyces sp. NBRC 110611]
MQERSSVAELAAFLRGELNRYSAGEKLPSSRALVERHRVSPVTVSRALAELAAEGLVVTRPGAGVFRAEPSHEAPRPVDTSWQEIALSAEPAADQVPRSVDATGVLATLATPAPGVIELHGGYLHPDLQPTRALSAALARAGRRPGAWGRPPVEGVPELRAWFAREIGGPGGALAPSDVLVTAGGQNALTAALRALAAPGAPVLVESPTYPGMLAVARASGVRPVPVPMDVDGVRTDLLADAFRASGARLFVSQPLFQNPTGAVLARERRREVLRVARAAGAFVIEDDFARLLGHDDAPALPPTLMADDRHGTVVHIRSLTKATSPNLRVGALAARGPVLDRLRAIQVVDNFFVPGPLQEAALELVGSPAWHRHLRLIAGELSTRRNALTTALRTQLPGLVEPGPGPGAVYGGSLGSGGGPYVPPGGFHLWLRLPDGTDEAALTGAALRAGVAVAAGRPYFAAEPPAAHLRLGFAAVAGVAELTEGIRRLRTACEEVGVTVG